MKKLTYHREGDYLIPNLEAPEAPRIGKYGTMRYQYLRTHHRGIFDGMLLEGSLNAHLEEIDRQANEMMDRLTSQMAQREGVTEALKAANQMEWVRRMNSIRSRAEDIVRANLIYM
ncbi:MAG: TnpV protein, partial [Oscillospiraceae bacterium]|nr:TnpV protein [Oscillospiraceae bacterium]